MKHKTLYIAIAALLPFCAASAAPLSGSDPAEGHGVLYRVIDADTFIVNVHDEQVYERLKRHAANNERRERHLNDEHQSFRLRLANVDTPESVHPDETRNTQESIDLSNEVKRRIEGADVYFHCYDWGYYGRLNCNMATYGNDEWSDFGYWLIREGHSPYVQRWGDNPFFHGEYLQAQEAAQ